MKFYFSIILLTSFFLGYSQDKDKKEAVKIYPIYAPEEPYFSLYPKPGWVFPDSLEDGKYVQYFRFDSTTIAQTGTYKNKVKHGVFKLYYRNGNIRRIRHYKVGIYLGRTYFFENGQKKAEHIFKDCKEVKIIRWYKNGQEEHIITEDRYVEWHNNGNKRIEKFYKNGLLHRQIRAWYRDGQVQYIGAWDMGFPIKAQYAKKDKKMRERKYKRLPRELKREIEYKFTLLDYSSNPECNE